MADQFEPEVNPAEDQGDSSDEETVKGDREEDRIAGILEEEREGVRKSESPGLLGNGTIPNRYRELLSNRKETPSEDGSAEGLPRRAGSPIDSLLSIPDDSPPVQGSAVSSPSSSIIPSAASRPGLTSPTPSFRPFDRRFQSRIASPSALSPRPSSPAFLSAHSRNASLSSNFLLDPGETEAASPPWEVVRWTKLKKLTGQAFSETGKRNFGTPTCIAVSASIVLGTSKGIILMFDYNQNLKMIIGPGTKAVESGAITSIAVSADHSTVGGGHANGSIFTWDTSRSARPFLHIPHLDAHRLQNRTMDGHIRNAAVTHLGFLGTRHTALVSADDKGMAFAHLATRGTGSLGRSVKTTRILGRYPGSKPPPGKPLKPSTVLAFAPLPLGNVERATDTVGLTAMLTPYLLVIVSTTPVAQTQHKSPRPKEVAPHSAMSGCLAWFPAVRLKVPDPKTGSQMSKVKLVYCWSNVLTVLDVDEVPAETKDKPPSLHFKARSRWRCEEAIVAVQWLSRSVLTVLTITQRLIVLEDQTMRMTEAFDLMHKHIYHVDLFSKQLYSLVEQHDEEDMTMHGVVADCFSLSFKAYKGRIFLLGFNDLSIGALSNWADRLIALMEHGDYVSAIQLATSYFTGDADKLTIGLPEEAGLRHSMVQEKLMEIMAASLKYAFSRRRESKAAADDRHLQELAETCFAACHSVGDIDFLFDDMYEWYEDAAVEGIFLETLEPYILDKSITAIPPVVVKAMVAHFAGKGLEGRLEEMICHMDTSTMDLDQIASLCKQHGLYDALIYVWNQALLDFITPLIELLALLVPLMQNGGYSPSNGEGEGEAVNLDHERNSVNALKVFPYLSYVLTGRVYPTEETMPDAVQLQAKAEIYWFLFSGKSITWPKASGKRFLTQPGSSQEPSFPYLRMILKYNAPDFLSALNEAFEDSFLNDSPEKQLNGGRGGGLLSGDRKGDLPEEQVFGLTVDRQYIVSILTEIMNPADFAPEDTVYLDMFIARNLPKYPQYLLLPGSTLTRVLTGLCSHPAAAVAADDDAPGGGRRREEGDTLAEDAQLSAEYLLSVYHPPDLPELIPLFKKAGFYRILKRIYKVDGQYGRLIQTYFEDPAGRGGVFACIAECLMRGRRHHNPALTRRQLQDVHGVIRSHARELVELDPRRAAATLEACAEELHNHVLASVEDEPALQYAYLGTVLEPSEGEGRGRDRGQDRGGDVDGDWELPHRGGDAPASAAAASGKRSAMTMAATMRNGGGGGGATATATAENRDLIEQYVRLMCRFDPGHVSDYVGLVQSTSLRLERLLPTMEETGVIDAAIVLMAQEGQIREAMGRLVRHLHTLEGALLGLLGGVAADDGEGTGGDLSHAVGITTAGVCGGGGTGDDVLDSAEELLGAMRKYVYVGIWLCQGQTKTARSAAGARSSAGKGKGKGKEKQQRVEDAADLSPDERLWLDLVDVGVRITKSVGTAIAEAEERRRNRQEDKAQEGGGEGDKGAPAQRLDTEKLVSVLRSLVQHTFTALLTATSAPTTPHRQQSLTSSASPSPSRAATPATAAATTGGGDSSRSSNSSRNNSNNISFLRIMRAFLAGAAASSPSLADLRAVLASIFSAYAYEESILRLSSRLLERSLFVSVRRAVELRQRGWRPRGSNCEACGRRVAGPGVAGNVLEAWEERERVEEGRRRRRRNDLTGGVGGGLGGVGGGGVDELGAKGKDDVFSLVKDGGVGGKGKGKGKATEPRPREDFQVRGTEEASSAGLSASVGDQAAGADGVGVITAAAAAAAFLGHDRPGGGASPVAASAAGRRDRDQPLGPLVVLACRHIYHQSCLDALQAQSDGVKGLGGGGRQYICPIDG